MLSPSTVEVHTVSTDITSLTNPSVLEVTKLDSVVEAKAVSKDEEPVASLLPNNPDTIIESSLVNGIATVNGSSNTSASADADSLSPKTDGVITTEAEAPTSTELKKNDSDNLSDNKESDKIPENQNANTRHPDVHNDTSADNEGRGDKEGVKSESKEVDNENKWVKLDREIVRILSERWDAKSEVKNRGRGVLSVSMMKQHLEEISPDILPSLPEESSNVKDEGRVAERLQINSTELITDLEEATGCPLDSKTIHLRPFKYFWVYEAKIRQGLDEREKAFTEACDKPDNDKTKALEEARLHHYKIIIEWMDTYLRATLELRKRITAGTLNLIAFSDLWHLFTPGELLLTQQNNCYSIFHTTGGRAFLHPERLDYSDSELQTYQKYDNIPDFIVDCYYVACDGKGVGYASEKISISEYKGLRCITNLPAFPIRFAQNEAEISEILHARGRKFQDLCRTAHMSYTGTTLDVPREEVDSEVMIDFRSAFQENDQNMPWLGDLTKTPADKRDITAPKKPSEEVGSLCDCSLCTKIVNDHTLDDRYFQANKDHSLKRVYRNIEEMVLEPWEEKICQRKVYGYALRARRWVALDIDLIKDVDRGSDINPHRGFQDLVLPKGHKDIVEALVVEHSKPRVEKNGKDDTTKRRGTQVDLVRGKGKGVVILLHGVPGVGKTSTAECVAAYTGRPLYPITCGDIGTKPVEVEKKLEHHFKLAHEWGCVLLLDEADVFLVKRERGDIKRNALVSVFLRTLEFYSGILFLTTNRVGEFDEAFRSRIHISLYYPPLNRSSTMKIWEMNLRRVKQSKSVDVDEEAILDFAEEHFDKAKRKKDGSLWNGRQIRNAFQTALALAAFAHRRKLAKLEDRGEAPKHYKRPKLKPEHFHTVAKAGSDFDRYLKDTHSGQSYSERAEHENFRKDDWTQPDENAPIQRAQRPSSPLPPAVQSSRLTRNNLSDRDEEDEDEEDDEKPIRRKDQTEKRSRKGDRGKTGYNKESEDSGGARLKVPSTNGKKKARIQEVDSSDESDNSSE